MSGYEERIELFHGDPLERRFQHAQGTHSPRAATLEELIAKVDEIDVSACQRVTFSGGNPPLHPEFARVIAHARGRGLGGLTVVCEASAVAEPGALDRLREAGIDQLEIVVGGLRARVHEAVMRDPGGHAATLSGLTRASRSGLRVYIVMPLIRTNARDAVPLLEYAIEHARPAGFLLSLPRLDDVSAGFRPVLLRVGEAARVAAQVFKLCQRNGLELGFTDRQGITPCAASELDAFAAVFHQRIRWQERGGGPRLERVRACSNCSLARSCRGVEASYVDYFGDAEFAPVSLDRSMNWRLKRINRLEEHDYKNVSAFDNDAEHRGRSLLRVNGHCQMACSFCFVDRTVPDYEAVELEREIDAFARLQTEHLVLSGGEPTLHPELARLIRYARNRGFSTVEIQTNGVKLRDLEYAHQLVDAGLNKATISLHSVQPERSDEITKLAGAFPKTVEGLRTLRSLHVPTQIAHVITKANYAELPAFVRFLGEGFPERGGHLSICFAIAQGISDLVYSWVIPSFSEIKPFMRDALDYCLEVGIGFGGMVGQGGYPPCMLDGEMKYYRHNLQNIYRSTDHDRQFYKAERCGECSFDPYCIGVRRDYITHYGESEIKPFRTGTEELDGAVPIAPGRPVAPHEGHMARPALVQLRRKAETVT